MEKNNPFDSTLMYDGTFFTSSTIVEASAIKTIKSGNSNYTENYY